MSQLAAARLDTSVSPNQGATSSSSSIHRGGPQVRAAAAEARQALLALASTRLGVQPGRLTVSKGVVSIDGDSSRSITYGELIGDKGFEVKFTGTAPQKPVGRYGLVGARVPRIDIPDKVAGKYVHMQSIFASHQPAVPVLVWTFLSMNQCRRRACCGIPECHHHI